MIPLLSPAAALGSAATLGFADFSGGIAGRRTAAPSVTVGMELSTLAALPLALWLLPFRWDVEAAVLTFLGGAVSGLGLILLFRAMTLDLIGIVAPISAVVGAMLPTAVGILGNERPHVGQLAGIVVGLAAIALINGPSRADVKGARAALGLAIGAGVCFGLFYILFHAGSSIGTMAFVTGLVGSALAAMCFAITTRVAVVPRLNAWGLVVVAGTFEGIGVVLYLFATFHGLLSVSALLTSFYPAFTILCARVFTRERLSNVQTVGAVLAVIAAAMIAAT